MHHIMTSEKLKKLTDEFDELKAKYERCIAFIKNIDAGYQLNQTDDDALIMLSGYEELAHELLKELEDE